jgi:hypothetical protein
VLHVDLAPNYGAIMRLNQGFRGAATATWRQTRASRKYLTGNDFLTSNARMPATEPSR